jgi:hypothetical protein
MWTKIKSFLLNRVLFLTLMGVFAVVVIGMLTYFQTVGTKKVPLDDLMEVKHYRDPIQFPMRVYCSGFDKHQMDMWAEASAAWKRADARLDVQLTQWDPPVPFSEDFYKDFEKNTLWQLDPNDSETAMLFLKYSIRTDGFAVGNFVAIVRNKELTDQQSLTMYAHELGHMMSFEHIENEYPAMMNLTAKKAITEYDLMQIDYVYPR